jgi:hypothetical protein
MVPIITIFVGDETASIVSLSVLVSFEIHMDRVGVKT